MNCCCVIGPSKSGTTLMACLLDSHSELSIIPLEVKFFEHCYSTLKNSSISYTSLNDYFFNESKLKLMQSNFDYQIDIMNSGRIDFSGFDFTAFKHIMEENARSYQFRNLECLFQDYIIDVHSEYSKIISKNTPKLFVSKEGVHGVSHISRISANFPKTRFIVMTRDPRDMYASFKSIALKKSKGLNSPSFKSNISPTEYVFSNKRKNCFSYYDLHSIYKDNNYFLFIRYEELVETPHKIMKNVAKFLDIEYNEILLQPTTAGNIWGGNSSSMERFEQISSRRSYKWKKELTHREIRVLEFYLKNYMKIYDYKISFTIISRYQIIKDILLCNMYGISVNWIEFLRPWYRIYKIVLITLKAIISCLTKKSNQI